MAKVKKKAHNRVPDLLPKCADNLERGCDPLNHQFLVENNITSDECYALAQQMAVAIRAFCRSPHDEQLVLMVRGCADDPEIMENMVTYLRHNQATNRVVKELAAMAAGPGQGEVTFGVPARTPRPPGA